MKKLVLLAMLACTATHAKDQFDRPQLTVPKEATTLTLSFVDEALWDGKRMQRTMQCTKNGGEKPASPLMVVTGAPKATQSLVAYFANPRTYHNQGFFKVTDRRSDAGWTEQGYAP